MTTTKKLRPLDAKNRRVELMKERRALEGKIAGRLNRIAVARGEIGKLELYKTRIEDELRSLGWSERGPR